MAQVFRFLSSYTSNIPYPTVIEARNHIREWAQFLKKTRRFLDNKGLIEVTTPCMVSAGAFEASIDTLSVPMTHSTFELHSSPEIEMKHLLAQHGCSIYQISPCFRDDPDTGVHLKEFTMLEFYLVGATFRDLILATCTLLSELAAQKLRFIEKTTDQLFSETLGIDLVTHDTQQILADAVRSRNLIQISSSDDWDDIFYKLLVEKIEPALDPSQLTIVRDYPASQAALAKTNDTTKRAERFEIYWKGMELCNGCVELGNLEELKLRYKLECELRHKARKKEHPYPQRLVDALERGLPESAGVAIGLNRVFHCLYS